MNFLILGILQAIPGLAIAFKNLFQQTPQQQGETDDAYVARLRTQSQQLAADTSATDAAVINETPPATVVPKTIPPGGGGFNAT